MQIIAQKTLPLSASFIPPSFKERNELINFIKVFFDFTYYLGTSPFRIVSLTSSENGKDTCFHAFEWKPQKVICAISNMFCLIRLITEFRYSSFKTDSYIQNPIPYFQVMLRTFAFLYKGATIKRFWKNQDDFVRVLTNIKKDDMLPTSQLKIQSALVIKFILSLCVAIAFADLIAGAYFVGPTWRWTPQWWYRQLVSLSRYTFFVGPEPSLDTAPELNEMDWVDLTLAVLTIAGLFQRYIVGIFCDHCILSHVLTLWTASYTFAKSISPRKLGTTEPEMTGNWDLVYRQYKAIRKLSQTINQSLGNLVTLFMAEAIIFYSINLDVTMVTEDFFKKGYMVYFYCDTFSILFISADICRQMDTLKGWLANDRNRKNIPWDELQIVLQELQSKDVGIRGSDIFTITYSLVASYCTLVVTYFIISVQHRNQIKQTALDG